jgi:hypothetical protein
LTISRLVMGEGDDSGTAERLSRTP